MHLHVHSHYSFLAGTLSVERLISCAASKGYKALALTDTNNVAGITEFYIRCRKAGIQPIVGAEVRIAGRKAVLLAKSWNGYQTICEIVTRVAVHAPPARIAEPDDNADEQTRTDECGDERQLSNILTELLTDSVFVLTADESILYTLSMSRTPATVYVELTKAQEGRWRKLIRLAGELRLPVVAENDVYFGVPDGRKLHHALRAISTNRTLETVHPADIADASAYFIGEEEFKQWFASIPEALYSREVIAAHCQVVFDMETSKFTSFSNEPLQERWEHLRALAEYGFALRYARPTPFHRERLEKELKIIHELGFVDYFLVAHDMIRYAQRKNYPFVGRGSGANSIVSYCLEITNVDPIELDLYFERFLNPERRSPPDFDIDFSWRNRDDVIAYVLERYGANRTAMICTIPTFSPRGAIRESGKILGMSEAEIKHLTSLLPGHGSAEDFISDSSLFHKAGLPVLSSQTGTSWFQIAERLLEFPKNFSIHCGGVILAPDDLSRYTATQIAPKGVRITQQDMFGMEDWRLEKLDILSTRGLGVFEDTMKAAQQRTGVLPSIRDYTVAYSDEKTKKIMREGKTIGCFYVESPAMIQLLKKLMTDTFEMLTAASSIIRPGVAQSGMMQAFIARHHDPSKIETPHPLMKELLATTYGVMVYQEDVIKVVHHVAGLSFGQADLLRRAMSGKMRSNEAMMAVETAFLNGCKSRGVPDAAAVEIWRQIRSFAGYSFCKAHSASYAVLSFQLAWLKSYFSYLFICAVLNNQGGYYRPEVYIQEAKQLGIQLLLPDVNASEELHCCPSEGVIQLGFLHVKDIADTSVASIIAARKTGGSYRDFYDFAERSGAGFEDIRVLIRCGACDCFAEERSTMLVKLRAAYSSASRNMRRGELPFAPPDLGEEISTLGGYSPKQITVIEHETFSYTVSNHLLDHYSDALKGTVKAVDIEKHVGKRIVVGGWMVAAKITYTKKHERMIFVNLDDSSGMIDVVLFPQAYAKYALLLRSAGPFRITGKVIQEFGVASLNGERVELLEMVDA